eukprot:23408_1
MSNMKKWDKKRLLQWVDCLEGYSTDKIKKIKDGINGYGATGDDVWDAEKSELKECLNIDGLLAKKLAKSISAQRNSDLGSNLSRNNINNGNNNSTETPFTLNIGGSTPTKLRNIKSSMNIGEIKRKYLEEHGQEITNTKMKGVNIKYLGEALNDESSTLKSYGILNGDGFQLFITYSLNGGMSDEKKSNDDSDDEDSYRYRKLRFKKYKQIKLSNKPDCIFGYTNSDGIKRAEMPCGCAMSADPMFNYMKSVFNKDFRVFKLMCPVPKGQCKGSDEQRHWKWPLVFIIADLSEKEINKYSLIIQNRVGGTKECPHCSALCERPANVKMWRVRCSNCNKSDWCFQCGKLWKKGGLSFCGNSNCVMDSLNKCLANTKKIQSISGWSKGLDVAQMRACPNCFTLIEYQKECQHMTCPKCPHEFCFRCLSKYDKKTYYSCKPNSSSCPVHPVQTFK